MSLSKDHDMYSMDVGYEEEKHADSSSNPDSEEEGEHMVEFTTMPIVKAYLEKYPLVSHHIMSYDTFVRYEIQETIDNLRPIVVNTADNWETYNERFQYRYRISYGDVQVTRPIKTEVEGGEASRITPFEARIRGLNYSCALYCDITFTRERRNQEKLRSELHKQSKQRVSQTIQALLEHEGGVHTTQNTHTNSAAGDIGANDGWEPIRNPVTTREFLGFIPVMVGSKLCYTSGMTPQQRVNIREASDELGGYFIINGKEKTIVTQDVPGMNRIVCSKDNSSPFAWRATIMSKLPNRSRADFEIRTKVLSHVKRNKHVKYELPEGGFRSGTYTLHCRFHTLCSEKTPVPLMVLFYAMGCATHGDFVNYVTRNDTEMQDALLPTLEEGIEIIQKLKQTQVGRLFGIQKACLLELAKACPKIMENTYSETERMDRALELLTSIVLQHTGTTENKLIIKTWFMGMVAHELCRCVMERRQPDSRDSYFGKHFITSGEAMQGMFSKFVYAQHRDIYTSLKQAVENDQVLRNVVTSSFFTPKNADIVTHGLKNALTGGIFNKTAGVSQSLERECHGATMSHLTRISKNMSKEGAHADSRQIRGEQIGSICFIQTPEGANIGMIKNLAIGGSITVKTSVMDVLDVIATMCSIHVLNLDTIQTKYILFINGGLQGAVEFNTHKHIRDIHAFIGFLRIERFKNEKIPHHTGISICYKTRRIDIRTSAGRIVHPYLVVREFHIGLYPELVEEVNQNYTTFDKLCKMQMIEFIDIEEMENTLIAPTLESLIKEQEAYLAKAKRPIKHYTHTYIHTSMILGVSASWLVFPDFNQSPRNLFSVKQSDQDGSNGPENAAYRVDTTLHQGWYLQKPLVTTGLATLTGVDDHPSGCNPIVAVMNYQGFGQEDSIILNQDSVDRGMFRESFFRNFIDVATTRVKRMNNVKLVHLPESFSDHAYTVNRKGKRVYTDTLGVNLRLNRERLGEDGIIDPAKRVSKRTALASKRIKLHKDSVSYKKVLGNARNHTMYQDTTSCIYDKDEPAIVDKVTKTTDRHGNTRTIIRTRETRVTEIGDKLSNRHGQKGIVGLMVRAVDLPHDKDGITPDMIVNTHAFPSRMTQGHLVEMLAAKIVCMTGKRMDASPFGNVSVNDIVHDAHENGFQKYGNTVMYCGKTGQRLTHKVYMGPCYYKKLKHQVRDKMYQCVNARRDPLTRQPKKGRGHEGGLRVGEMERDAIDAYGASSVIQDRYLDNSDAFTTILCERCGFFPTRNALSNYYCSGCSNATHFIKATFPYSAKVLIQQLMGLHIDARPYMTHSEKVVTRPQLPEGQNLMDSILEDIKKLYVT
ncbi:MAG: DNA-directed RNA polymerase subunit beta [Promethearchaeota archaeon]